jgi:two-component system sensor histidine kinase/response regulator
MDVNMPDLDGIEACRRLQADPDTAGIPVLFLTAQLQVGDKVRAFATGAVDYLTKPFQFEEAEARIKTHLEIQRQRRELKAQHEALLQLEYLRDSFTHMVAHDMRGPLTGIIASLELSLNQLSPVCAELKTKLGLALTQAVRLNDMIRQMLELSRMESREMPLEPSRCDLARLAEAALAAVAPTAGRRKLYLHAAGPVFAWCDPTLIHRVLVNLLGNALKFTSLDGTLELTVQAEGKGARVSLADDGPGIAPEHQRSIFEKFHQAPGGLRAHGVGLGLAFCKAALAAHQGEIGVVSEGRGCTFWFTLPGEGAAG